MRSREDNRQCRVTGWWKKEWQLLKRQMLLFKINHIQVNPRDLLIKRGARMRNQTSRKRKVESRRTPSQRWRMQPRGWPWTNRTWILCSLQENLLREVKIIPNYDRLANQGQAPLVQVLNGSKGWRVPIRMVIQIKEKVELLNRHRKCLPRLRNALQTDLRTSTQQVATLHRDQTHLLLQK